MLTVAHTTAEANAALKATTAYRRLKLVTEEGKQILRVLCLNKQVGSVLAITAEWEGRAGSEALNLNGISAVDPHGVYVDGAEKVVEQRAEHVINEDGRLEAA